MKKQPKIVPSQDYSRFGRLNTKKLNNYLEEYKSVIPYDMRRIFPISTTQLKYEQSRYAISSFKNMSKKYRYCYGLDSDCIAEIKRKGSSGIYDEVYEIDNNRYVFSHIDPEDIDENNCYLVYDVKVLIPVKDNLKDLHMVIDDMYQRKASHKELEKLKLLLDKVTYISNSYEYIIDISNIDIKEEIFNEFFWRIQLLYENMYQSDFYDIEKVEKAESKASLRDRSRKKISDGFSLLENFYRFNLYDNFINDIQSKNEYLYSIVSMEEEHTMPTYFIKKCVEIFEDESMSEWFYNIDKGNEILISISDQLRRLQKIKDNYSFLENHYSKAYRDLFQRYNKVYSLWKTQQIFKKYKEDHKKAVLMYQELSPKYNTLYSYLRRINKIKDKYYKDLGDNKIPNKGFGYSGVTSGVKIGSIEAA